MSAKSASVIGPAGVGSIVNTTPRDFRRRHSSSMSVDSNAVDRNALREHRGLKRFARRVGVRLERELEIVWSVGCHQCDPPVFADGDVVFHLKTEHLGVELQCLVLIVDHDAGELDAHEYLDKQWRWGPTPSAN